jgi:hypothetical protein
MLCNVKVAKGLLAILFIGLSFPLGAQPQNQAAVTVQKQGNFVNVSTQGNLAVTQQLQCIGLTDAKSTYTPPDLHTGIKQCLMQGDFGRAAELFALAGVYAKFDAERVADVSARDGGQVLILQTFSTITPEAKANFKQAMKDISEDPKKHSAVCSGVRKVGPPSYFPKYLVLHGMNALLGKPIDNSALLPDFNAAATWENLQATYLSCNQ